MVWLLFNYEVKKFSLRLDDFFSNTSNFIKWCDYCLIMKLKNFHLD